MLLIHSISINHDEAIKRIYGNKIEGEFIPAQIYKELYTRCKANNNEIQVGAIQRSAIQVGENANESIIFKILPYYTVLHSRLGGCGHMSSDILLEVRDKGIWSIYFGVIGKKWSRRIFRDRLVFYTDHQHLIV